MCVFRQKCTSMVHVQGAAASRHIVQPDLLLECQPARRFGNKIRDVDSLAVVEHPRVKLVGSMVEKEQSRTVGGHQPLDVHLTVSICKKTNDLKNYDKISIPRLQSTARATTKVVRTRCRECLVPYVDLLFRYTFDALLAADVKYSGVYLVIPLVDEEERGAVGVDHLLCISLPPQSNRTSN